MIRLVTESDLMQAAIIHSESWIESHRTICTPEFLAIHTPQRQKHYLESQIEAGAQLYMMIEEKPVGVVSVRDSLIENLYVLPSEQRKGYGSKLLMFAIQKCRKSPTLWILNTNYGARQFYEHNGFQPTGKTIRHSDALQELEFRLFQHTR